MADAYTNTTTISNLVQTAYDRALEFQLRDMPLFRNFADKRPVQQAMPGSSVVFQLYNDISEQTATLTEGTDPDAVSIGNTSTVTVSLAEYGAAVLETRKLSALSLSDVDPAVVDIVTRNCVASLDSAAQAVVRGGTHYIRKNSGTIKTDAGLSSAGTGTTVLTTATDIFSSPMARLAVTKLRALKAVPRKGDLYGIVLHPEVAHDLRAETGSGGWRLPHEYNANGNLWNAEVGAYEGAFYVESPRCYTATDGASSAKVYRGYAMGLQALAEAVAIDPQIVFGNVVDKLQRTRPVGWKALLGWSVYRQDALIRFETSSSVA